MSFKSESIEYPIVRIPLQILNYINSEIPVECKLIKPIYPEKRKKYPVRMKIL